MMIWTGSGGGDRGCAELYEKKDFIPVFTTHCRTSQHRHWSTHRRLTSLTLRRMVCVCCGFVWFLLLNFSILIDNTGDDGEEARPESIVNEQADTMVSTSEHIPVVWLCMSHAF